MASRDSLERELRMADTDLGTMVRESPRPEAPRALVGAERVHDDDARLRVPPRRRVGLRDARA